MVALRYAIGINGTNFVAVTKLDVLDKEPVVKICTSYRLNGQACEHFPSDLDTLSACEPQCEEMPGWLEDTTGAKTIADLPTAARAYLARVEELLGVPARIVSVGNERKQTIFAEGGTLFA